ncbi:DsbC family protein [Neisseria sp. Ec49-e6-T10]|uniref:DsbC family protein n=1 Tax=Neisseria sp. Ec49-e6-T10 TaxID=3140744 RepID=UPI003EB7E60F
MKHSRKLLTISILLAAFSTHVFADVATTKANLSKRYPNTTFASVKETVITGIYEVVMGKNVAYTDQSAQYFIFGHLFDMPNQKDLTAGVKESLNKVDYAAFPFDNAIKIVKGNGGKGVREFALFTDPDCPYCQRLEETLAGMTDYTVYVFLYPIASLHPNAAAKAESVWCASNQGQAWNDLMLSGKQPAVKKCANPVEANIKLAAQNNIRATPSMIHKNGSTLSGAVPRATLENWLGGQK